MGPPPTDEEVQIALGKKVPPMVPQSLTTAGGYASGNALNRNEKVVTQPRVSSFPKASDAASEPEAPLPLVDDPIDKAPQLQGEAAPSATKRRWGKKKDCC